MRLQQALEAGDFALTAEVMPPRGGEIKRTLEHAALLKDWVHAVNVTDGSRAVMRMSSLADWLVLHPGQGPRRSRPQGEGRHTP